MPNHPGDELLCLCVLSQSRFVTKIARAPERHTDTLIDCVHAHVFVEFGRCVFLPRFALGTRLAFQSIYVFHTLSKFWGPKICKWETNDDHSTRKIIRKIQPFRQFCTNDGEEKSPRFSNLLQRPVDSSGQEVYNKDSCVHTSLWQAAA